MKSGNTTDEIDFLTTKKTFLKENYPDLANGVFMHPPFIRTDQEEQDGDMLVCKALKEEFSEDVAFIFRTSESILDPKVVDVIANALQKKLESREMTVEEVEQKLKQLCHVTNLNWRNIETEADRVVSNESRCATRCNEKIIILKKHLHDQPEKKNIFL